MTSAPAASAATTGDLHTHKNRLYRRFLWISAVAAIPVWIYAAALAGVWGDGALWVLLLSGGESALLFAAGWALERQRLSTGRAEILMAAVLFASSLALVALGSSHEDPGVRRVLQEFGVLMGLGLMIFLFLFRERRRAVLVGSAALAAILVAWVGVSFAAGIPIAALEWHRLVWVLTGPPVVLAFLPLYGDLDQTLRAEAAQRRRFEREATLDPLTGVANRRAADDAIATAFSRAEPLSLILFDLDHFKRVNDRYGHERGDAVLSAVAATVAAELRRGDLLARWGGEEFVVICTDTDIADALALAERLRLRIGRTSPTGLPPISASFGVATRSGDDDPRALLRRADAALYRAKAAGRDRVASEAHPPNRVPSAEY